MTKKNKLQCLARQNLPKSRNEVNTVNTDFITASRSSDHLNGQPFRLVPPRLAKKRSRKNPGTPPLAKMQSEDTPGIIIGDRRICDILPLPNEQTFYPMHEEDKKQTENLTDSLLSQTKIGEFPSDLMDINMFETVTPSSSPLMGRNESFSDSGVSCTSPSVSHYVESITTGRPVKQSVFPIVMLEKLKTKSDTTCSSANKKLWPTKVSQTSIGRQRRSDSIPRKVDLYVCDDVRSKQSKNRRKGISDLGNDLGDVSFNIAPFSSYTSTPKHDGFNTETKRSRKQTKFFECSDFSVKKNMSKGDRTMASTCFNGSVTKDHTNRVADHGTPDHVGFSADNTSTPVYNGRFIDADNHLSETESDRSIDNDASPRTSQMHEGVNMETKRSRKQTKFFESSDFSVKKNMCKENAHNKGDRTMASTGFNGSVTKDHTNRVADHGTPDHAVFSADNTSTPVYNGRFIDADNHLSETESDRSIDNDASPRTSQMWAAGRLVWGTLRGLKYWPGMLFDGPSLGFPHPGNGKKWIIWFGDHKFSMLPDKKIYPLVANFEILIKNRSRHSEKHYLKALTELLQECSFRCSRSYTDDQEALDWAMQGFGGQDNAQTLDQGRSLPIWAIKTLEMWSEQFSSCSEEEDEESDGDNPPEDHPEILQLTLQRKRVVMNRVVAGEVNITDVCIICCRISTTALETQHPLFEGGLCADCKELLMGQIFVLGEDGLQSHCCICAKGGLLYICDNESCTKVYCTECVKLFVGEDVVKSVEESSSWQCFLCSEHTHETHGLLVPKSDFKYNLIRLSHKGRLLSAPLKLDLNRPIRVMSLYDGIGTGRYVLDQLGLDVEVYYASEIDGDAITVVQVNHGDKVIQLGDITQLTAEKLDELGPIDLLIGGSPCNDLSLCNPLRKGVYEGSGRLFFHYYRILRHFQSYPNHVFFLFENVFSMTNDTKANISTFMECEPAKWDAKHFSPMQRARYFWGNIPAMYCPLPADFVAENLVLSDVLTPNLQREALVEKIRTVTTKSNSLLQTKERKFPVKVGDGFDTVWIQELEILFGFPLHYTDVANFPISKRQALLGKSWSVPVVKYLLAPLLEFFGKVPKQAT